MMELFRDQLVIHTPSDLVLWDVVDEHARESAFLFQQWRAALFSALYTLDQAEAKVERRLRRQLDGLAVGGPVVADRLLYPALEDGDDPDRAAAAALGLLATGDLDLWRDVFDALVYAEDDAQRRPIALALELYDGPSFDSALRHAFEDADTPHAKASLLEILAARRLDPGEGLDRCFTMGFPPLTAAAVRTTGALGRQDHAPRIEPFLEHDDPLLRAATVDAGLSLGIEPAWRRCLDESRGEGDRAELAMLRVALLGGPKDQRVIADRLEHRTTREAALWALGFTGRIELADRCLPFLESGDPRVAKLAAESLCAVIGLDLVEDERLHHQGEAETDVGGDAEDLVPVALDQLDANPDDLDADLVPDAVDLLPAPKVETIGEIYRTNRSAFDPGERYLFGEPFTPAALVRALGSASMRRRHALALELACRTSARYDVTTEASVARQRRQLAGLAGLGEGDFVNRFGES